MSSASNLLLPIIAVSLVDILLRGLLRLIGGSVISVHNGGYSLGHLNHLNTAIWQLLIYDLHRDRLLFWLMLRRRLKVGKSFGFQRACRLINTWGCFILEMN